MSRSLTSLLPCTTPTTPGGKPASANSSTSRVPVSGAFSAGLRRNVFPQATATDIIHSGIKAGKLNGGMPTTTPTGSRMAWQSTSREMSVRVCPISWEGMPQANSTTSSPRRSEPRASLNSLPFSRTMLCATSEKFFSSRLPELEQDVSPIRRRSGAPAREGTGGGSACLVHLLRRGLAHRRQHLGRVRRIADVAARVPTALDPGSADQVQRGSRTRGCCRRPIRGSNGAHEVLRKLESLFTDVLSRPLSLLSSGQGSGRFSDSPRSCPRSAPRWPRLSVPPRRSVPGPRASG